MSIYIDADAVVLWEKGEFDLLGWLSRQGDVPMAFPATVWQQLHFGVFGWSHERAAKRRRFLESISPLPVVPFSRAHAERAAELT